MRRGRLGATATILLFCLAACSSAASPTAAPRPTGPTAPPATGSASEPAAPASAAPSASPLVPARAGLLPSVLSAPIYAGVDLGIYRKNGVDVTDIETFTATPDIMTLLAGGRLDFGQVTMGSAALNAYNRGVDLVITAAGNLATVPLVVRKDLYDNGTLRTVRDLRGRRVALNGKGTSLEYSLAKALEYGGLTPDDVEVPILSWPDQVVGLANGAIDAGLIGEPMASAAVTRGIGVILEDDEMRSHGVPWFAPGLQGGLLMMNKQWADANPRAAQGVVRSYVETVRRIQGAKLFDDAEALASVEKWVSVKPEVVKTSDPPLWSINGRLHVPSLMDMQRYFVDVGGTDYRQPLPIERLYDERYLNAALAEIGTLPEP